MVSAVLLPKPFTPYPAPGKFCLVILQLAFYELVALIGAPPRAALLQGIGLHDCHERLILRFEQILQRLSAQGDPSQILADGVAAKSAQALDLAYAAALLMEFNDTFYVMHTEWLWHGLGV